VLQEMLTLVKVNLTLTELSQPVNQMVRG